MKKLHALSLIIVSHDSTRFVYGAQTER